MVRDSVVTYFRYVEADTWSAGTTSVTLVLVPVWSPSFFAILFHHRSIDCSERQLEALALYMGHSLKEQRETYDRRTMAQKVEPAIELLADLTGRSPTS